MDDRGDPVVGASVIVETAVPEGRRAAVLAAPMTNDLGEYRAGGLPPGPVTASIFAATTTLTMINGGIQGTILARGRGDPYERVYYPGVGAVAQAATLTLQPGDERTGRG
jgi:hypothetical protein